MFAFFLLVIFMPYVPKYKYCARCGYERKSINIIMCPKCGSQWWEGSKPNTTGSNEEAGKGYTGDL
jgi:ribosomal protein L37AE/L43A